MTTTSATYRVRVDAPRQQLAVELTLTGLSGSPIHVEVPTWVPGAYGFMKYGRDLFDVEAEDDTTGRALRVTREAWSGFTIESSTGPTTISYRVTVADTAWGELTGVVDHRRAVLLGTHYLHAPAHRGACRVAYEWPEKWAVHHPAGAVELEPGTFEYPSYAVLLDTPVVAGDFEVRTRECNGVRFDHVFLDRTFGFDTELDGFLDSIMKIAQACHDVFGSFPFERYAFVYSFNPTAHWGLEHANATMIALEAGALIDPAARFKAVRVAAHELFHAWNVCRLKPAALMSPDHARGSFPDGLWVSEGFTRWYEFLLCVRAGEVKPEVALSNVVNFWRQLTALPAYARTTASDSSRATFLNHNRYPGSVNATVDYYDLGMLITFDLDATLRLAGKSLDAEFKAFYDEFVHRGFTSFDLEKFFERRTPGIGALLAREVETAGALSTLDVLARLGFDVTRSQVKRLGIVLAEEKGPVVANIADTCPAARSGLAVGDEITRVDGLPFNLAALKWLVSKGRTITLDVKRGHHAFKFEVTPEPHEDVTGLTFVGDEAQLALLRAWFAAPAFTPPRGASLPLTAYDNFHGIQTIL